MTDSILITGATGFIGRAATEALLDSGRQVRALVRSPVPKHWGKYNNLEVILATPQISDSDIVRSLSNASSIVHLAGLANISADKNLFAENNSALTERLCRHAANSNLSSFINLSSIAAISSNSSDSIIDDFVTAHPDTPYGESKQKSEISLQDMLGKEIAAISLRPPLVIGAGARGNWRLLQNICDTNIWLPFAWAENLRNFVTIQTLTKAILHLVSAPIGPQQSGDYCIADGEAVELRQIVRWLRSGMNRKERLFGFPPAMLLAGARSIGKARQAAGLLGELRVDDSRFRQVFGFDSQANMQDAIRLSGSEYAQREAKH